MQLEFWKTGNLEIRKSEPVVEMVHFEDNTGSVIILCTIIKKSTEGFSTPAGLQSGNFQ